MRDNLRGLRCVLAHLRSGLRADLRSERENWNAKLRLRSDFRLERANLRPLGIFQAKED